MKPRLGCATREKLLKSASFIAAATLLLLWPSAAQALHGNPLFGVGNHVPPLGFIDITGKNHNLAWTSATEDPKAVVLVFFDRLSASGMQEFMFLESLASYARTFDLGVYGIEASGLDAGEVKRALEERQGGRDIPLFPVVADINYELSSLLDVRRLPTTLLIESHGVILLRMEGFDNGKAVELARKMERSLHRTKGLFSFALREIGIGVEEEAMQQRSLKKRGGGRAASSSGIAAGDTAPNIILQSLNGQRLHLASKYRQGQATVVIFWEALCLPCVRELNYLETVYRKGERYGLQILAIEGSGLGTERVRQIMERYERRYSRLSFPRLPDPDGRASGAFGVQGNLPQTFIIDNEGKIAARFDIFIDGHEKEFVEEVEKALSLEPGTLLRAQLTHRGTWAADHPLHLPM